VRAAASSIPSGRQSTRRQISATSASSSRGRRKLGATALARRTKRRELGKRRAPPELERLSEDARRALRLFRGERIATGAREPLEPRRVDQLRLDLERVAARPRRQDARLGTERLSELGDVHLQSRPCALVVARPQLLDQPVRRDDFSRVQDEQRDQGAAQATREPQGDAVLDDLERPEDPELERHLAHCNAGRSAL
jgi:hypothetical protein